MNIQRTPDAASTENSLRAEDRQASGDFTPPTDVFPDFAIPLEEANARIREFQRYVREHMVEGEDYGVIPGSTKPTLFKPGAEKLNALFGYAPHVAISNRVEEWEKGFIAYEVKVSLINKRTQQVEAEGVGSCNSRERRYARQDAAGIANTILKMAKKRALVDATLSATRASGLFTQDLEDMDFGPASTPAPAPTTSVVRPPSTSTPTPPSPAAPAQPSATDKSQPTRSRPPAVQPAGQPAVQRESDALSNAQHGAILSLANRVFGRPATAEDFTQFIDKPLEELNKSEASTLISRLRQKL